MNTLEYNQEKEAEMQACGLETHGRESWKISAQLTSRYVGFTTGESWAD